MPGEAPLLVQTDTGPTLRWKGLYLYPPENPIEYARRKARVFSPAPRTLFFVPSVGLGHGLSELLERLPEGCAIMCVEVHQEVMGAAVAWGLPRDPRLTVIRTDDPLAVAAALTDLGPHRFRRIVEVPLCAGYRLASGLYARFRKVLEDGIARYWRNRLTLIAMGSLQVRNILSNLPLLGAAADFSALSTALPVVVAGAGPSLEQSIPSLAKLRNRYLLAAVDTALPTLMANGVAPDLVIALEAQVANLQDFIPARAGNMVLACDLSSHPSIARLFAGRLAFFSSRFAPLRIFDRLLRAGLMPAGFPALGSVGVAAAHAAIRLTRGNVFLTGLDFSFPGALTHARGAPHHLAMLAGTRRLRPIGLEAFQAMAARTLVRVPDKHGRPVGTDSVLRSYRDNLAVEIQGSADRVMDFGESGLALGVRSITAIELEERLACSPSVRVRLAMDTDRRFSSPMLRGFVSSERALLERAAEYAREAAGARDASEECRALLADVDYAWVHFPDEPDLDRPDPGFLARVGVAAGYYAMRLKRIESVL